MLQLNLFVKKLREIVCVETDLYDQSLHKQAARGHTWQLGQPEFHVKNFLICGILNSGKELRSFFAFSAHPPCSPAVTV